MSDLMGRQPFRRSGLQRVNGPLIPSGLAAPLAPPAPPPPSTGDTIYSTAVTIYGVSFTIYGA